MALFRGLTADRRPFDEFRARARHSRKINNVAFSTAIDLDVFEWLDGATHGEEINNIRSVEELRAQSRGAVRVIFAPQDVPTPTHGEGLFELFEACGIPTAFVDESLQGVSQSFAARQDVDGTTNVWFHFLCKTLTIVNQRIVNIPGPQDEEISGLELRDMAQGQSQANYSWIKPGFVLKIREQKAASPKTKRTSTSDSDDTLTAGPLPPMVELFCFGAPNTLQDRFRTLIETSTYDDVIGDPYALLEIGFEELYKVMDVTVWNLADVFGLIETKALEMATNPGRATQEILKDHFTGLHNLAKHTIYLRENCEAGLATLEYFLNHHETVMGKTPNSLQKFTHQGLQYRKTLFESIGRRLTSLDSRISNIIQLSFNTVTQGDSRVMQSENKSMKTIAVTTLVFLPLGTIASIFGSQFMKLEEDEANHITVSQDFWLLWVIALPLTIIVVVIWRVWYMDARDRLVDGEELGDGHGYFGWKTFLRRVRRKSKKMSTRTAV